MADLVTKEGKAFLKDPTSGGMYRVDAGAAEDLVARGRYVPATQAEVDQRTAERESSTLGAAGRGAIAGLASGVLSIPKAATATATNLAQIAGVDVQDPFADLSGRQFVEDIGGLTGEDVVQGSNAARQQLLQDMEAHPWAYGIGEAAGQVAGSALYGGVLGRAARGAGLGARGANIATGIVESGALGGEMASEDAWVRDQQATAEQTLAGIGLGALFGGTATAAAAYAPGILRRVFGKAATETVPEIGADIASAAERRGAADIAADTMKQGASGASDDLERQVIRAERAAGGAETAAARIEGARTGNALGETLPAPEVGLLEQTATKSLRSRAADYLSGLSDDAAIGAVARQNKRAIRELGVGGGPSEELKKTAGRILRETGIVSKYASEESMFQRASQVAAKSGDDIGRIVQSVDDALGTVNAKELSGRLEEQVSKLKGGLTPETQTLAKRIERTTKVIRQLADAGELKPSQLHGFRQELAPLIKWASTTQNPVQTELKALRRIATEQLESEVDRAGKSGLLNQELLDEYRRAKETYRVSKWAEDSLGERVGVRNQVNRALSLTDQGVAAAGFIGAGGGLPGMALAGASAVGNKMLRERGLGTMASFADDLAKRLATSGVDVAAAPSYAQRVAQSVQAVSAASDERAANGIRRFFEVHDARAAGNKVAASTKEVARRTGAVSRSRLLLDGTPKENRTAYQKHAIKVLEVASNPELATERLTSITGSTLPAAAPKLNAAMAVVAARAANYLAQNMPAPPKNPDSLLPQLDEPPPVSRDQIEAYYRRVEGVEDPDSLYDDLQRNVVYPEKLDAVKTVWPKKFDMIRLRIFSELVARQQQVPYSARATLEALLDAGGAIEPSMGNGFHVVMANAFDEQMKAAAPVRTSGGELKIAQNLRPRSESIVAGVR